MYIVSINGNKDVDSYVVSEQHMCMCYFLKYYTCKNDIFVDVQNLKGLI